MSNYATRERHRAQAEYRRGVERGIKEIGEMARRVASSAAPTGTPTSVVVALIHENAARLARSDGRRAHGFQPGKMKASCDTRAQLRGESAINGMAIAADKLSAFRRELASASSNRERKRIIGKMRASGF